MWGKKEEDIRPGAMFKSSEIYKLSTAQLHAYAWVVIRI